jgi:pimeloyl-ACP methyl ester carboxylesterase
MVSGAGGVQLAVYRDGPSSGPLVLAVHGYPDNASVWDCVVELLAPEHRLVRYDVRGAGGSDRPSKRADYRLDVLAADLVAVLDAVSPDAPVHLLAHDWGSIQAWECVTDPGLAGRIASFTSISGPCLAHVQPWLASSLRERRYEPVARQLLHSYYLLAFQLPVLPELLWRSGLIERLLERGDRRWAQVRYRRDRADAIAGLQLYRANLFRPADSSAGAQRSTSVPVQVIAPGSDPFVSPALQLQAPADRCSALYPRPVAGGHWLPVTDPGLVARACAELVDLVEHGRPSAELRPGGSA